MNDAESTICDRLAALDANMALALEAIASIKAALVNLGWEGPPPESEVDPEAEARKARLGEFANDVLEFIAEAVGEELMSAASAVGVATAFFRAIDPTTTEVQVAALFAAHHSLAELKAGVGTLKEGVAEFPGHEPGDGLEA